MRVSQTVEQLQSSLNVRLAAAQIHSSLLSISVGALLLPAAYHFALSGAHQSSDDQRKDILKMSHGVSISLASRIDSQSFDRFPSCFCSVSGLYRSYWFNSIIGAVYAFYLIFQFWSHQHLYKDTKQKSNRLSIKLPINPRFISERRIFSMETLRPSQSDSETVRWRSSIGSKIGLGAPSRPFSLHSPSETTLTTSLNAPFNVEKTIDSHPTIRLVTEALKEHAIDAPSSSSGLSLPTQSRWRSRSEDDVSTMAEGIYHNLPEPMDINELPPPGHDSILSTDSFKEPRLSLTLTLLLLTVVTVVSCIQFDARFANVLFSWSHSMQKNLSKVWTG